MDTKQLHSILIELEAAGLRPQIGIYKEENSMTNQLSLKVCDSGPRPDEGISLNNYINVNVTDNSMRSSGFKEGDVINVKLNDYYFDGAVVLARVHDGIGLCAYCRDDEHNPWLIPRNEKYAPIEIESEERIIGRAVSVVSRDPKISVSKCMDSILEAKNRRKKKPGKDVVSRTIKLLTEKISVARLWFSVYKMFVEYNIVKQYCYEDFVSLVERHAPEEYDHLPVAVELQRMEVQSFTKKVSGWDINNAPVRSKRFWVYVDMAKYTKELLNQ